VQALSYVQKEISPARTTAGTGTSGTTGPSATAGAPRTAGTGTTVATHAKGTATQPTLSTEGRRLIQDLQRIIETTKLILGEKNSDELIQDFVWRTSKEVDKDSLVQGTKEGVLGDLDDLDQEKVGGDKDLGKFYCVFVNLKRILTTLFLLEFL